LDEQLAQSNENIASLKDTLLAREEDIAALEQRISDKTIEFENFVKEKEKIEKEDQESVERLESLIRGKEQANAALTDEIVALNNKIAEISDERQSAIVNLNEKDITISQKEAELSEMSAKIEELKHERDKLIGESELIRSQHQVELSDLKTDLEEKYKERQSKLLQKLEKTESGLVEREKSVQNLEKEKHLALEEAVSFKELVGQKQTANEMLVEDIESLTRLKNQMAEKVQSLTREVEVLRLGKQKFEDLRAGLDEYETDNQALKLKLKLLTASSQKRSELEFELYNSIMKLYGYLSEKDPSNLVVTKFLSKGLNDDDKEKVLISLRREVLKLKSYDLGEAFTKELDLLLK
jgi:DNA repair exonuclease SbcCD ATPase subunit